MLGLGNTLSGGIVPAAAAAGLTNEYSIAFDGSNDHITTADAKQSVDNATTSFWMKSSKTSGYQNVFGKGHTTWYIGTFNNKMYVKWAGTGSSGLSGGTDVCDSAWHHHVIVFAGGYGVASEIRVYMDGVLKDTLGANDGQGYTLGVGVWSIGHYGGSNVFIGNLDEVAIWEGIELDADAIAAIYNSGTPTDLKTDDGNYDNSGDLSHWWRMGDGDTFATIQDNQGSNDGTMVNMASGDIVADIPS